MYRIRQKRIVLAVYNMKGFGIMKTQPNILVIMPDQMRGDCLSLERHPVVMTPNIDALGAQGTQFTRAYTTCPSCIAARRSLLTGQHPATNGMVGYQEGYPIMVPTLPQLLSSEGYTTAITGRYMHQSPYEEGYGYQTRILGSDYIDDDDYARELEEAFPGRGGLKSHGLSFNGWTAKPWHFPEHLHPTNWAVTKSREILSGYDGSTPLFLTTSFFAPHPPLFPPAFYLDRYLNTELPQAAIGSWADRPDNNGIGQGVDAHRACLEGDQLRNAQAGYFGLINHIDDQLYWLITDFKIACRKAQKPWIIIFTSDHGEMLGDHYFFRKCEPYEGSSRIPFLICGSPELELVQGQACSRPVCLEDIMPTLLDAAGIQVPETVDGQSLLPLLRGEPDPVRKVLHGEHATCYSTEQAFHMLTDGEMKYIWRPYDGSQQLFNLTDDPQELTDLSPKEQYSDKLNIWRQRMVEKLENRPEGFSDGMRLIAGCRYDAVMPEVW
jgi:arylsulfatase A-like enzyme